MINYIINIIINLLKRYLTYKFQPKLDKLTETTGIPNKFNIDAAFDVLYKHYNQIYKDKGLRGVLNEVQAIKDEIRLLNITILSKSHKTLSEKTIQELFSHLIIFKEFLTNIKYTVEMLLLFRLILGVIGNIAFIPIFVLAIWILFKKLSVVFSLLFTSSYISIYLTNRFDYITATYDFLNQVKEYLRGLSIKWHNWLFSDNLISRALLEELAPVDAVVRPSSNMIERITGCFNSIYDYLSSSAGLVSNLSINWSYTAYTSVTLLIYWLKAVGSSICTTCWGFLTFFSSSDDPDSGDSLDSTRGNINPSIVEVANEESIRESWLSTLPSENRDRARRAIMSDKPSAINTSKSSHIEYPLSSATIRWSNVTKDSASNITTALSAELSDQSPPLIEVTPPSPTVSDSSDITIRPTVSILSMGESSLDKTPILKGEGYPNLVIYPPINNSTNDNNSPLTYLRGATYPDSNLGCWQDTYIKYSLGVGTPESYEHFTALNERFPNLSKEELEVFNQFKSALSLKGTSFNEVFITLFDRMYVEYNLYLKSEGLRGVWQYRKDILNEINSLNFSLYKNRHNTISSDHLIMYLPKLGIFKDILTKIKISLELLNIIRRLLKYIVNVAFIPVCTAVPYIGFSYNIKKTLNYILSVIH